MTILKNCILRYIYNILNSSSRWDATAKLYFFFTILSPQIYDLMDGKNFIQQYLISLAQHCDRVSENDAKIIFKRLFSLKIG